MRASPVGAANRVKSDATAEKRKNFALEKRLLRETAKHCPSTLAITNDEASGRVRTCHIA